MTPAQMRKLDRELREHFDSMMEGMGRLERRRALELCLTGLLLDGGRKSVEPMPARMMEQAQQCEAVRQRLQQCVSVADWSDDEMRHRLALKLEAKLPQLILPGHMRDGPRGGARVDLTQAQGTAADAARQQELGAAAAPAAASIASRAHSLRHRVQVLGELSVKLAQLGRRHAPSTWGCRARFI
jgi:hypothetical protein